MLGLQPFGLPLPAPPILSAVLPFGFAQIGVLGAHPPSAYSPACARQFGCAFGQKPAHLVSVALFSGLCPKPRWDILEMSQTLNTCPPETRKVVGSASFPSFSRSVSTDYRLLSLRAKTFVLADKDCVLDSNFLFCGLPQKRKPAPINCFHFTPSLRSLRFLVYSWRSSLRSAMSYYSLWLWLRQPTDSKGCLIDLLPCGSQNYH